MAEQTIMLNCSAGMSTSLLVTEDASCCSRRRY